MVTKISYVNCKMPVMALLPVTVLTFQNFILGLLLPGQTVTTATSQALHPAEPHAEI